MKNFKLNGDEKMFQEKDIHENKKISIEKSKFKSTEKFFENRISKQKLLEKQKKINVSLFFNNKSIEERKKEIIKIPTEIFKKFLSKKSENSLKKYVKIFLLV
jgi:hypothetical protein